MIASRRASPGLGWTICMASIALAAPGAKASESPPRGAVIDVAASGAAGDGKTKDTGAIGRALAAAAARGGGTVYLGPGTYLSGTLILKSRVMLYLDAGAILLGSKDLADFPPVRPAHRSYTEKYVDRSLIFAEKERDVAVAGKGVLFHAANRLPGGGRD